MYECYKCIRIDFKELFLKVATEISSSKKSLIFFNFLKLHSPSAMPYATIMVTLKLESIANDRGWVLTNDNGGYDRSITMHDSRTSTPASISTVVGGMWNPWTSPEIPKLNEWIHVTAVFRPNGEECSVWINGVKADHTTECKNGSDGGLDYLTIGGHPLFSKHYADAWIRKVYVFDEAVNDATIEFHASQALCPPRPPPGTCGEKEDKVTIEISTDDKGADVFWFLKQLRKSTGEYFNTEWSGQEMYDDNTSYKEEYCVKRNKW